MTKKIVILIICAMGLAGCSTMQQRVVRLKEKGENVVSTTVPGDVDHAKIIVREVTEELKLVEYKYGDDEFKEPNENFMLFSNYTGKTVMATVLFGPFVASPTSLGVFFNYDQANDQTDVTISEETSSLSFFKLRKEVLNKIKLKSFPEVAAEPEE